MAPVKEPTFFSGEFQIVKTESEYYGLYDGVTDESVVGEASGVYLTDPASPKILRSQFPDAKFLVILRPPSVRAYSLYLLNRRCGFESISNFERALGEEAARFASPQFRENCPHYFHNFMYFRSGLYGEQLARYFQVFDPSQFLVLTLDDLKQAPAKTTAIIQKFLGVRPYDYFQFSNQNSGGKIPRSFYLQQLLETRLNPTRRTTRLLRRAGWQFNCKAAPPLRADTQAQLNQRYSDDFDRLRLLTGISW